MVVDIPLETQFLMFLAGCSFVLALVLSVTGDGSGEVRDVAPVAHPNLSRRTWTSQALQPLAQNRNFRPAQNIPSTKARPMLVPRYACKLPVELTDYIIDLLHSDLPSLKACALANRIFLPRARFHLFRTVSVRRNGKDPYKLRRYLNVARCIRRVVIHGNLVFEVVNSTLVELGLVESLHLIGSDDRWKEIQWTLDRSQFPRFPRLKELSLSRVYFRSLGEMMFTLRSFHDLATLSMDFEDIRYTNLPPRVDPAALAAVQIPLKDLHMRLNFLNAAPGQVPQVLVTSAGSTLRHLSLDVLSSPQRLALSVLDHVNLSNNISLESLEIHLPWYISRNPWVAGVSQDECQRLLHALLSQLNAMSFRTIKFHIAFPNTSHYNNSTCWHTRVDFRFLDALAPSSHADTSNRICGTDFSRKDVARMRDVASGLTDIELTLGLPSSRMPVLDHQAFEAMQKVIYKQLPLLTSRGVLRIVEGKTVL